MTSDAQAQTARMFGYQWRRTDTFESEHSRKAMRDWLLERYGDIPNAPWWREYGARPDVLDAGCGAALSAIELFGPILHRINYVGVDISEAVEVAEARFRERGFPGRFLRHDIVSLPFPDESFDVIFSEGVLHHTDSTENALKSVARKLRKGGRFLFYVYRRKGPIREFTDDLVRAKLKGLAPEEAWQALVPLTRLGEALGKLNVEIDIPEAIPLLDIPAGRMNLQRLFYWHVCKAFYRPEMTLDEMNHINFDWFAPTNSHRQSLADIRQWCREAGLSIEREIEEDAGITVIARRG